MLGVEKSRIDEEVDAGACSGKTEVEVDDVG